MSTSAAHLVRQQAFARGEEPAYVEGRTGERLTWGDLATSLDTWSGALEAAGLAPGTPVGLIVQRPLPFIRSYLALLAAGAVALPLDPTQDHAGALAEFSAAAVITDGEHGRVSAENAGLPAWEADGVPRGLAPPAHPTAPPAWASPSSVLLRTSGSTGAPKGVPLPWPRLLHGARAVAGHHRLDPSETVYSPLPLFHVNAQVVGVLSTLVSGATLVVDERFRSTGFWDVLDACGATVLNAVPAILALLGGGEAPPDPVRRRVRFARSASAPLPVAVLRRFQERCGIGVLETYGMTEASGQICANPLDPAPRKEGSVGLPVGLELRVVGDDGAPVDTGQPGSVQLRGPSVVDAYVIPDPAGGPPDMRPCTDADGWLTTGDAGRLDADGFVFLLGRHDGVINRGGEKVYPREIEEVLRRHPAVSEAVVVPQPDDVLGERPVAFVVAAGLAEAAAHSLRGDLVELCRRELGRHKQPAWIRVADQLPTTPNGKVRRDALRELASQPQREVQGPADAGGQD